MAEKKHYSYNYIHSLIATSVLNKFDEAPGVIVAISGGGLIPARMLRTLLKARFGVTVPIRVVGLMLYDDDTEEISKGGVQRLQWPTPQEFGASLKSALVVDEVDDTRTTLQYAIEHLRKDLPSVQLGVFVVHDKQKPKRGVLPADVKYLAAAEVEDFWIVYPWDAVDIADHEKKAQAQGLA
ncbi:xanthine phosphoribosyltransferase 1 [Geranomyces variabilis]|nr:xanthine phosphoribosyltransferase 1 [Geranomyces variabilis]KAJ3142330.1 hypoxanthine-guanine phosphoribosyltransferase [Geranomyces variabilis]